MLNKEIWLRLKYKTKPLVGGLVFVCMILYIAFHAWGKKNTDPSQAIVMASGFNMQLPEPVFDKKAEGMTKLGYYDQADKDSIRRRDAVRQDPYLNKPSTQLTTTAPVDAPDLTRKLDSLRIRIANPPPAPTIKRTPPIPTITPKPVEPLQTTVTIPHDPELDKLSEMLDKLVTLQKGGSPDTVKEKTAIDTIISTGNAIAAEIQTDQTLINGLSVSLRLLENASIGNLKLRKGQIVYGKVSVSNDRAIVRISSILEAQSIHTVSLIVYDMDGMEGIRISNTSAWAATRQAADNGIGSLNLGSYDPSLRGQLTNVGVQATRSLFSRRVRTVSIPIRHGYKLMLREGNGSHITVDKEADSTDSLATPVQPLSFDSLDPFLHRSVHVGKVRLTLKGIYLKDGLMWFWFDIHNRSKIDYTVDYLRASIIDRKQIRSMAVQDLPLPAICEEIPPTVTGDTNASLLFACHPFTLEKGKAMTITLGERNGARLLEYRIGASLLLKAK